MELYVEDAVKRLGIQVIYILIYNINNKKYDPDLKDTFIEYQKSLLHEESYNTVRNHPYLIGYRDLHHQINIDSNQLLASPESMFKVLFEKRKLPSINSLVDCYNLISMQNKISIGAHDLCKINGNVTLRLTNGEEIFKSIGNEEGEKVSSGEYCYFDDTQEIICRLDCKQCNKTKITRRTKSSLIVIQGNKSISLNSLLLTSKSMINLISKYNHSSIDYSISLNK